MPDAHADERVELQRDAQPILLDAVQDAVGLAEDKFGARADTRVRDMALS